MIKISLLQRNKFVKKLRLVPAILCLFAAIAFTADPSLPQKHQARQIEGWSVRVDQRLLEGEQQAKGEKALRLLQSKLVAITTLVPEKPLAELQKVTIQIDLDYGKMRAMQYHPSADWLKANGYSEQLERCVHIPNIEGLLSRSSNRRMPLVVLHELAHAYHDQVLGFEDKRVMDAWKKFSASGKYQSTLTYGGTMGKHYGLTDQKEFFAEMTEAYFGSNDFYPFVGGELKQAEPEIYQLMEEIWGAL
jgi:hypothetical protein